MLGKRSKPKTVARIDTLIGQHSEIQGDVAFSGGLHVDGTIRGDVSAPDDSGSVLTLSEHGAIEGEVRVPHIILNGSVVGDVHAAERIELAARARVTGNVYYNLIEMAMGAEVNGSLVHRSEAAAITDDTAPVLSRGAEGEPESAA
ncbi:MAG: polymer-forming cytoskeletal protein [Gammaproteobacteria bacterium]